MLLEISKEDLERQTILYLSKSLSSGVKILFWKINWFLKIHKFQKIQTYSIPGPSFTDGRLGILRGNSSPSHVFEMRFGSTTEACVSRFHTSLGYTKVKSTWTTDFISLHVRHLFERGIFRIDSCSPTIRASRRKFHRNTFISSEVFLLSDIR